MRPISSLFLFIQWGYSDTTGTTQIIFPISYTTKCYYVSVIEQTTDSNWDAGRPDIHAASNVYTAGFQGKSLFWNNGGWIGGSNQDFAWFSLGK